ncbi:uncharacterized protein DS421_5g155050 [Arachis hypogaea]|nr:uncharacterized protein DS421_5g155050 [Arachis hypogaea]
MVQNQSQESEDLRSRNSLVSQSKGTNSSSPCSLTIEQSIKEKHQQILHLLQEDEESSSKEESEDNQIDEDCYEVCLAND